MVTPCAAASRRSGVPQRSNPPRAKTPAPVDEPQPLSHPRLPGEHAGLVRNQHAELRPKQRHQPPQAAEVVRDLLDGQQVEAAADVGQELPRIAVAAASRSQLTDVDRDFPYWQPSGSSGSPNEMMGSYSRSCEACHGAPGGEAWPSSSEPQQATEASAFIPQVWYSPALTETNSPSGGED